jgi:hypothetical protein
MRSLYCLSTQRAETPAKSTHRENGANEHAVVLAKGTLVTLGKRDGELLIRIGLAALQGLEGEVKATKNKKTGKSRRQYIRNEFNLQGRAQKASMVSMEG